MTRAIYVSIHAPVRGATYYQAQSFPAYQFQSTRPCGARRKHFLVDIGIMAVSIHAPVRGATSLSCTTRTRNAVSIHAPVRGATSDYAEEGRLAHVSIHAPVRGATV
mgnify:FL=1